MWGVGVACCAEFVQNRGFGSWIGDDGMRNGTRWVIVDTETDGLYAPIHVVEIAAQMMVGWEPSGEPFRVFLNHGVPIPWPAVAVHGYTREFLASNGLAPREAHALFAEYVQGAPLVCHNLSYDWNRALGPEWQRLGVPPAGCEGFCSMLLARRVIHETSKHKLDILKAHFGLDTGESHHAGVDVETVVQLFTKVMQPRLTSAGLDTFEAVKAFSRRSPVKRCLADIRAV